MHWDGKILADLAGRANVDRIAVLVSYNGTAKFLGAPKIETGTGKNIADAVFNVLVQWNLVGKIVAACFDTTSTNTGPDNGALVILSRLIGRNLINLACRHHTYEIILKNVFEKKMGPSSAPEPPIFNRFANRWHEFKNNEFKSGYDDEIVKSKISKDDCKLMKDFCCKQLERTQIRSDYRELLELTIKFLGGDGGDFKTCGATSNARFMSKAIYCLKMFMFRTHFTFTTRELNCIRDISIFIVRLYVKNWYGCTNAIESPNQDLNFLREAYEYAEIDKVISTAIIEKIQNHFWYNGPVLVGLAFLDPKVSIEIKRKMLDNLKLIDPIVALSDNRKHSNPKNLLNYDLSDFVSHQTNSLFSSFDLESDFLELDPSTWADDVQYETAVDFFKHLFVVNDAAERGVKFMKDYNRYLTRDDKELQFILQVVDQYRHKYPSHYKYKLTDHP